MAGTAYNGIPGNVLPAAGLAILSTTHGNPTTIHTAAAHGLRTGDVVDITEHHVCTAANGVGFVVTVTGTNTFTIPVNSSTYSNGANTGFVWPQAFTGNVTLLPANGDAYSAATYIPAAACEADRTAWQLTQTGLYRIAGGVFSLTSVQLDPTFSTIWGYVSQNTGHTASAMGPIVTAQSGSTPKGSILQPGPFPVGLNDIVDVSVSFSVQWTGTGNSTATGNQDIFFALYGAYYVPGFGGSITFSRVPASGFILRSYIATAGLANYPRGGTVRLRGRFSGIGFGSIQGAGATDTMGLMDFQIYAGQNIGDPSDYQASIFGDILSTVDVLRPNGITVET